MSIGWHVGHAGTSARTRDQVKKLKTDLDDLEVLVREVLQNSLDAWDRDAADFVRVRFRIRTLKGERKREFLEALDARAYHREAKESREYQLRLAKTAKGSRTNEPAISIDTLHALDPKEPQAPLPVLLIEDYGATGLTGTELDNEAASRFCACCRDAEFSVKQSRQSGGSYGKGKNALWRHARSRLVLFYSKLKEPQQGHDSRFIGVGKLPWYALKTATEEEGRFSGRLEFGNAQNGFSLLGRPAITTAKKLGIERQNDEECGTSICLVGFDPLSTLREGTLAEEIQRIAERYYWPAIAEGSVEVSVVDEDTGVELVATPDSRPELQPFVRAYQAAHEGIEERMRASTIKVPAKERRKPATAARMTVACDLLNEPPAKDATPPGNSVALIRGFGMVVNYLPVRAQRINASPYAGVCLAGMADPSHDDNGGGDVTPGEEFESLISYAEPEAHDRWSPIEFQGSGWHGAQKAIKDVLGRIRESVSEITGGTSDESEGATMPELAKRFKLSGAPEPAERFLSIQQTQEPKILEDGRVRFRVQLDFLRDPENEPRSLGVRAQALLLDSISGRAARKEPIPIQSIRLEEEEVDDVTHAKNSTARFDIDLKQCAPPFVIDVFARPPQAVQDAEIHYGLKVAAEVISDAAGSEA